MAVWSLTVMLPSASFRRCTSSVSYLCSLDATGTRRDAKGIPCVLLLRSVRRFSRDVVDVEPTPLVVEEKVQVRASADNARCRGQWLPVRLDEPILAGHVEPIVGQDAYDKPVTVGPMTAVQRDAGATDGEGLAPRMLLCHPVTVSLWIRTMGKSV